ncbi:unnamed protein product [Spodoptera exigua]|nr:unnamed protein product [Spodoptera exigua]
MGKSKRDQSLEDLRQHIHKWYIPLARQFIVLFPEGGFLHKRREVSQRFAEKNNLPKLEYVSLPRAGAMKVIMEEVGPHRDQGASTSKENTKKDNNFNQSNAKLIVESNVGESIEWVLDVTIAYPDRIPLHLQDIVCGIRPSCATHLHYRLYPSTEQTTDGLPDVKQSMPPMNNRNNGGVTSTSRHRRHDPMAIRQVRGKRSDARRILPHRQIPNQRQRPPPH